MINRRSLLKAFATAPLCLYGMRGKASAHILDKLPTGTDVNLVFHGFFFFDFQPDALIVASPQYEDHNFLYRDEDADELKDMPQEALDYTTQLKWGSRTPVWPDAILNFSKKEAKLDVPLIPRGYDKNTHGSLLILPYPERIVPIRYGGTIDEFTLGGNIAQYIKRPADKTVKLITCLQYFKKTKLDIDTCHYYAEHCIPPDNPELLKAFNAARSAFGGDFKKGFDLTFTQNKLSQEQEKAHREHLKAISGDDYNDEAALRELRNVRHNPCQIQAKFIRTANCPQFGMVSNAAGSPTANKRSR